MKEEIRQPSLFAADEAAESAPEPQALEPVETGPRLTLMEVNGEGYFLSHDHGVPQPVSREEWLKKLARAFAPAGV